MDFIHLDLIPSTNTWVKDNVSSLDPNVVTCVTARGQTQGRGRGRKTWISPPNKNLYVSFYCTRPGSYPHLSNLAQLLSLACAKVLISQGISLQLKWPNDLLLNKKKCGGVLVEVVSLGSLMGLILGLGLNINMDEEDFQGIGQAATSLKLETGKNCDLIKILQLLTEQLTQDLMLLDEKGFTPFLKEYESLLIHKKGDQLVSTLEGKKIEGTYAGIDSQGHLLLQLASGRIQSLASFLI
jgi:BirA family biotin operon repressor/biotin-[acetyl-CoA-carboxylase] ligase